MSVTISGLFHFTKLSQQEPAQIKCEDDIWQQFKSSVTAGGLQYLMQLVLPQCRKLLSGCSAGRFAVCRYRQEGGDGTGVFHSYDTSYTLSAGNLYRHTRDHLA